ncbi:MAG: hypothetical protein ACRD3R_15385, partial [Terriglobales bacterium]
LKELANARLIKAQPVSRFVIYRASFGQMNQLLGFLTENCCCGVPAQERQPTPEIESLQTPEVGIWQTNVERSTT